MTTLPTCWYCPECGYVSTVIHPTHATWIEATPGIDSYEECTGDMIAVPLIPPGTPLPVILDALGIPYREGRTGGHHAGSLRVSFDPTYPGDPVLVVDNPATDEAHDG